MRRWTLFIILMILMVSCSENSKQNESQTTENRPSETATPYFSPETVEPFPNPTRTPTIFIEPTATNEIKTSLVCPLFKDEDLENLMESITNPFYRPIPGSDNPHQGVDFGDLDPVTRIAKTGKPVHAITAGKVAMVLNDRFPYGNAILIEVPLSELPDLWQIKVDGDQTIEREIFHTNLTCPGDWEQPGGEINNPSFYILYAHFEGGLNYQIGDSVQCGEELGKIGDSGNALAPHVHVEMRLGPGGVIFEDMSHYSSSATNLAMENYCRWRVSGWYELLDPMSFFLIQ